MKTPLAVITSLFALSFLAGMFGVEVSDGFYAIIGFGEILCLGWMWVIQSKQQ